jgi:hypothetical protein
VEGSGCGLFQSTILAFNWRTEKNYKNLSQDSHCLNKDFNLAPLKYKLQALLPEPICTLLKEDHMHMHVCTYIFLLKAERASYLVRFEAFTAVTMKNVVFWDVALCRSCVNRRFGGTYRLHLQARKLRERRTGAGRWLHHTLFRQPYRRKVWVFNIVMSVWCPLGSSFVGSTINSTLKKTVTCMYVCM